MKINNIYYTLLVSIIMFLQFSLVSCDDDPGVSTRFTSTKDYASDFLKKNPDFSQFVEVLQRATGEDSTKNLRLVDLLGTYGSYTVFAPTNKAIDLFLASKGVSSVAELSKEDCDTIALNSIIEGGAFFTTDYSDGTYPMSNMIDQYITIISDTSFVNGKTQVEMFVNVDSKLTQFDDSVANGVVHTVDHVLLSNTSFLPQFIKDNPATQLFASALYETRMSDSLMLYEDEKYSVGPDSIDWTNDALVKPTAVEYDNVAYMEHRYFKYTAFICPDSVLKQKYNITTLDELEAKAHELYDPVYPEDANVTDRTDRRNALNRFVSYSLLDRYGSYYTLTANDGPNSSLAKNFNTRLWDIADWYETMMPYSIMKCSFPMGASSTTGLYINRRGVQSRADKRGTYVRGAKVTPASSMKVKQTCLNGIIHYIDDIIAYDKNTQEVVLNERLRIDCSTLSPDFMNSGARGIYTKSSDEGGKYGVGDNTSNHNNKNTCLGFKEGTAKNFWWNGDANTHLHVRPRVMNFWSYQGDEVTVLGTFDITVKLPPVPAGTYELRLFTCVSFSNRGIIQVYIDGEPQGIPFDMRPDGEVLFGWKSDASFADDDAIAAFDKSIHNLGWMKGPYSYCSGKTWSSTDNFRMHNNTIRKVLGHFVSDGKTDHYLRIQQKMESNTNALNFDFIELCPSTVYNNEYLAEDKL